VPIHKTVFCACQAWLVANLGEPSLFRCLNEARVLRIWACELVAPKQAEPTNRVNELNEFP